MALSLQGILERVLGTRMTKAFTEGQQLPPSSSGTERRAPSSLWAASGADRSVGT